MAIRQAATIAIPDDLPAAHLFLEDIEQLERIFSEMAPATERGRERGPIHYTVDKSTSCDNIGDLQKLGGKHHQFEMGFVDLGVTFSAFGTRLRAWDVRDADKWRLYGKVLAIFRQRPRRLRIAGDYLPWWAGTLLAYAFLYPPFFVLSPLIKKYGNPVYWTTLAIYYFVAGMVVSKLGFRHSIVELRYAHEATTFRERWKAVQPYILVAMGALAYALAERIVKAIWP
jgi:hypothetical protein